MVRFEYHGFGLAVPFERHRDLAAVAKRLKYLHCLRRISQRLTVNVLDQVARPEAERGKLSSIAPRIDAIALLLAVDEIGCRADDVRQPCNIL